MRISDRMLPLWTLVKSPEVGNGSVNAGIVVEINKDGKTVETFGFSSSNRRSTRFVEGLECVVLRENEETPDHSLEEIELVMKAALDAGFTGPDFNCAVRLNTNSRNMFFGCFLGISRSGDVMVLEKTRDDGGIRAKVWSLRGLEIVPDLLLKPEEKKWIERARGLIKI